MGEQKALAYTQKALFYEEQLLQALQVQFNRQADIILSNLTAKPVERALKANGEQIRAKDYVSVLIDWDAADEDMKATVTPHILQVIIETGQQAMRDLGLDPGLYEPYAEAIQLYMEARATKIATDINDTTERQIRATLTEGINAGESGMELRARVEAVMGIAATARADLITVTEVARAQSAADIFAWEQSGVVEAKEFYTTLDERRCAYCKDMHGKVIGLDQNYFDKGDVQVVTVTNRKGEEVQHTMNHDYDDVPAPPLHNRCRCTLLPVRMNA
ncbi:phage minor head protein [Rhodococcus ruber]|uniref:phage minor head protein n=1 Tax=Rhodococcus ruber TaxID=1830 RepID=UPI001F331877|nr:phage minor head protein [Rhodococcus ruber]MCF8783205.1 phage head morphogenesis protein [Rhodococcus ruber]